MQIKLLGTYTAGKVSALARVEPFNVKTDKSRRGQKAPVRVSRRKDDGASSALHSVEGGKIKHGADRERRALCGEKGARTEKLPCILLRLADYSRRLKETVCSGDLGQVVFLYVA